MQRTLALSGGIASFAAFLFALGTGVPPARHALTFAAAGAIATYALTLLVLWATMAQLRARFPWIGALLVPIMVLPAAAVIATLLVGHLDDLQDYFFGTD